MTDKERIAELEKKVAELEKEHEFSKKLKELKEEIGKNAPTFVPVPYPYYYPPYYYPVYPIWISPNTTITSSNATSGYVQVTG
jgi:hypothetical protein